MGLTFKDLNSGKRNSKQQGRLTGKTPMAKRILDAQGRAMFAGIAIAAILLPVAAVAVVKVAVIGGGLATLIASLRS